MPQVLLPPLRYRAISGRNVIQLVGLSGLLQRQIRSGRYEVVYFVVLQVFEAEVEVVVGSAEV